MTTGLSSRTTAVCCYYGLLLSTAAVTTTTAFQQQQQPRFLLHQRRQATFLPASAIPADVVMNVKEEVVADDQPVAAIITEEEVSSPVVNVAPRRMPKMRVALPNHDTVKAETTMRALLATRLQMEASARDTAAAEEAPVVAASSVAPRRPRKMAPILPVHDAVEAEKAIRGLLSYRLEQHSSALSRHDDIIKGLIQPETPEEKELLCARYGAIDDVGDRAYLILSDLGLLDDDDE